MSVLVVIGSGPGIGVATASLFAQKRSGKIALLARNASRLQEDKSSVLDAARQAGKNAGFLSVTRGRILSPLS